MRSPPATISLNIPVYISTIAAFPFFRHLFAIPSLRFSMVPLIDVLAWFQSLSFPQTKAL